MILSSCPVESADTLEAALSELELSHRQHASPPPTNTVTESRNVNSTVLWSFTTASPQQRLPHNAYLTHARGGSLPEHYIGSRQLCPRLINYIYGRQLHQKSKVKSTAEFYVCSQWSRRQRTVTSATDGHVCSGRSRLQPTVTSAADGHVCSRRSRLQPTVTSPADGCICS